jgi:DNA-binding LytR/AlgR family response regulator
VVDYLPLPCTKERVQMLIEHLRNWLALRELERWKDEQLISVIQKNAFLTQQLSDAGLSDREFSVDEDIHVVYCVAERNYSVLHRIQDATIQQEVISKSIGTLAEEFGEKYSSGEHPFLVRIHNSTIVNIKYVESVQKHDNRKDYIVRLRTGEEFILSRTYKHVVERLPKVEKKRRAARVTTRTRPTD